MIEYDSEHMPEEIKAEKYFSKHFTVADFFIIVAFFILGQATQSFVAESLQTIYVFGMVIIGFVITRNSRFNPKKKIYESFYYYLSRDGSTYESINIENPRIKDDEEGED